MAPAGKPCMAFIRQFNSKFNPNAAAAKKSAASTTKAVTAGVDSARENLERSMALAKAKKEENTYVDSIGHHRAQIDSLQNEIRWVTSWWQEREGPLSRTPQRYHSIHAEQPCAQWCWLPFSRSNVCPYLSVYYRAGKGEPESNCPPTGCTTNDGATTSRTSRRSIR